MAMGIPVFANSSINSVAPLQSPISSHILFKPSSHVFQNSVLRPPNYCEPRLYCGGRTKHNVGLSLVVGTYTVGAFSSVTPQFCLA
jgi:hypothetical protein